MSRRLALIGDGLAIARSLARRGHRTDALAQTLRMLRRTDLTVTEAADAHRVAGELLLDTERFTKARQHLRSSLALEPDHARTQFLMGLAFERDPNGNDRRAARCYRAALRLVPDNPAYRAAFGRAAVRCDRVKLGVKELLAAGEAALTDVTLLTVVVDGLLEAGRLTAADRITVKALFSCPGSGEVRRLRERVRFETAQRGQRRASSTQDAGPARDGAVRLLPFLRLVGSTPGSTMRPANGRRDVASAPRPHFTRPRSRSDR